MDNFTAKFSDKSSVNLKSAPTPTNSFPDFPHRINNPFKEKNVVVINENDHQKEIGGKLPILMKKGSKSFMAPTISAASKVALPRKKILAERNEGLGSLAETQIEKKAQVEIEPITANAGFDLKIQEIGDSCKFPAKNNMLCSTIVSGSGDEENKSSGSFAETQIEKQPQINTEPMSSNGDLDLKTKKPGDLFKFSATTDRVSSPCSSRISDYDDRNCVSPDSSSLPYDPLINYLSPRPQFLRYKPNRRFESVMRREAESKKREEEGFDLDQSFSLEPKIGSIRDQQKSIEDGMPLDASCSEEESEGQEVESDEEIDQTEEENWPRCSNRIFKCLFVLLALIWVFFASGRYVSDVKPFENNSNAQGIEGFEGLKTMMPKKFHSNAIESLKDDQDLKIRDSLTRIAGNLTTGMDKFSQIIEEFLYNDLRCICKSSFPYPVPRSIESSRKINGELLVFYLNRDLGSEEKEPQVSNRSMALEENAVRREKIAFSGDFPEQEQEKERNFTAEFVLMEEEEQEEHEKLKIEMERKDDLKDQKNEISEQSEIKLQNSETLKILGSGLESSEMEDSSLNQEQHNDQDQENFKTERDETEDFEDQTGEISEETEIKLQENNTVSDDAATGEISETLKIIQTQSESSKIEDHNAELDSPRDSTAEKNQENLSWIKPTMISWPPMFKSIKESATAFSVLLSAIAAPLIMGFLYLKNTKVSAKDSMFTDTNSKIEETRSVANPDYDVPQKSESNFEPSAVLQFENSDRYQAWVPKVELLGEYAPVEIEISDKKTSSLSKTYGEESIKFSQERRTRRKSTSSASINLENPILPEYSAAKSPSYGSFTDEEKVLMKNQGSGDEEKMRKRKKQLVMTPVRRSTRIRNQAMSP